MIGRLFAWLRLTLARSVLCDIPAWPSEGRSWLSERIEYPDLAAVAAAGRPRLEPYARLAPVYDAYSGASWWSAQYASYLHNLRQFHGRPMASLLDLGCGSGQVVVRFANRVERVVGLDSNPHMLAIARKRWNDLPSVSFVEGDIRTFALDAQFDAIICASDALNYALSPTELEQALVQIGQHLRSGGFFVCDVLPGRFQRDLSVKFLHLERDGGEVDTRHGDGEPPLGAVRISGRLTPGGRDALSYSQYQTKMQPSDPAPSAETEMLIRFC